MWERIQEHLYTPTIRVSWYFETQTTWSWHLEKSIIEPFFPLRGLKVETILLSKWALSRTPILPNTKWIASSKHTQNVHISATTTRNSFYIYIYIQHIHIYTTYSVSVDIPKCNIPDEHVCTPKQCLYIYIYIYTYRTIQHIPKPPPQGFQNRNKKKTWFLGPAPVALPQRHPGLPLPCFFGAQGAPDLVERFGDHKKSSKNPRIAPCFGDFRDTTSYTSQGVLFLNFFGWW